MLVTDDKSQTLYMQLSTLQRLIDEKRVGIWDLSGPVILTFRMDDPYFPGALVDISEDVPPHAVCKRRYSRRKGRRIVVLEPIHEIAEYVQ